MASGLPEDGPLGGVRAIVATVNRTVEVCVQARVLTLDEHQGSVYGLADAIAVLLDPVVDPDAAAARTRRTQDGLLQPLASAEQIFYGSVIPDRLGISQLMTYPL